MKVEILVGLIAIGVIGAVFIPLAFDPAGVGGIDFIECDEDEIMKYILFNGTLQWECAVDRFSLTEIELGSFANENTEFRPHLVRGTNVADPVKDFGEYSIRVLEFLPDNFGEVSWDYLVPQDYELGEDLEFIVYWFKEDGLADGSVVDHYNEQSTACQSTTTTAVPLNIIDGVEYDFEDGESYLIMVNTGWGNDQNHEGTSVIDVRHGTTVFEGSRQQHIVHNASPLPCNVDEELYKYFWWTLWQPNATQALEDISINVDNTDNQNFIDLGAILYDDTTISILKLSEHFAEDTDYFSNVNSTDSDILNSWATGSDATISFTPVDTSDWLVLGSNLNNGTTKDYSYETRLLTSGSISDTLPFISRQGESQTTSINGTDAFENDLHSFARVFTLGNSSSTTFAVQTQVEDGEINPDLDQPVPDQRLHNQIFALDLDKFTEHAYVWTPATLQLGDASDFVDQIDTLSVNATNDDRNIWIIADVGIDNSVPNLRTQLDNVDVLPDETFQSYDWESGQNDQGRWALTTITSPVASGLHTLDLDGGSTGGGGKGAQFADVNQRTLSAVVMSAEPILPTVETVCMEVRLMSVDVGQDLSNAVVPTFGDWKEVCASTIGGADILRTFVFNFNSTENPFEAEEVGMIQLKRHSDNSTSDNYSGKVFSLFGELQWIVSP